MYLNNEKFMKAIIIFTCCIMLFSCKSKKTPTFINIYKTQGHIYPNYILLKTQPNIFEMYSPAIYYNTIGLWEVNNDTIFLFPKYEYWNRNGQLICSEITPSDSTMTTIPQQYLIKGDRLIDVTNYKSLIPYLFNDSIIRTTFYRCK